jgi:hypothetical protein
MSTWIILGLAGLGIISAIIAFLKTLRNQRYRFTTPQIPIEERLAACPKSAEAVIIKADKRRFLVRFVPALIVAVSYGFLNMWAKQFAEPQCAKLFAFSLGYISTVMMLYFMPLGLFVISIDSIRKGIKILKTGYFPLLDSVHFQDTISQKGIQSKLQGVFFVLIPILFLICAYQINNLHHVLYKDMDMLEIQEFMDKNCEKTKLNHDK